MEAASVQHLDDWRAKGYSVQNVYGVLKEKFPDLTWRKQVWNKHIHPRYALISWLVLLNRIKT